MTLVAPPGFIQLFSPTIGKPVQWRLLSGNNREAGRGLTEYVSLEECRAAIVQLQESIDDAEPAVRRTSAQSWSWQLLYEDAAVASASRNYDRMIRCEQAAEAFVRGMRTASISDAMVISNARRWESPSLMTPLTRPEPWL